LATFAGRGDSGHGGKEDEKDPTKPNEELLADLAEAVALIRTFLTEQGFNLNDIIDQQGFARNKAIVEAKEAVNENDQTRKRFEVMAREVFKKFKACINVPGVNAQRNARDAIDIIYKSLQSDRDQADISDIIRQLHNLVDDAIHTKSGVSEPKLEANPIFDISKIDFERLRKEFEKSDSKRTTVQNLKNIVERKLNQLLRQNPLRTNFQEHYEKLVKEYNQEKDRVTIEQTFTALLKLVNAMNDEEKRAVREKLSEESLALFDLLRKPDLSKKEIDRIKNVAVDLLKTLKAEQLKIANWKDKEASRDAVKQQIFDFLYDETTGLPVEDYDDEEIKKLTENVFRHIYRNYPTVPSPIYNASI